MKHMKKIVSLVLAMMMVFAMTLGVSASDATSDSTYSITINNSKAGHTYQAYQIFSGTLSEVDGSKVLLEIAWGTGAGTNLLTALKDDATIGSAFTNCSSANDVAKVLAAKNSTTDKAFMENFASVAGKNLRTAAGTASTAADATNVSYVISGLSAGYYLIKDADDTLSGAYDAHTDLLLKLVESTTVTPKSGVPTLTKKVHENSTTEGTWRDGADAAIGEEVEFKLTGTMPEKLDTYPSYSYTFHDDLSDGLTLKEGSITVKIGETDVTNSFTKKTKTSDPAVADNSCDFELSCTDIKAIQGVTVDENTQVVVTYKATLNERAVIAGVGNPNTAYLEFSNNPNGTGTGKTPVDKVVVFTYELVANKVDSSNTPLAGAKFTLYKKGTDADNNNNVIWTAVGGEKGDGTSDKSFTFTGLDAGVYKLSETTTPQGYNTADDIIFKIVSTYDTDSADPKLTDLEIQKEDGTKISGEGGTFTVNLNPSGDSKNITTTIQNMKGSTLPSTGGMGTTLFYVAGAILAVGAAVLLAAKRRMSRSK